MNLKRLTILISVLSFALFVLGIALWSKQSHLHQELERYRQLHAADNFFINEEYEQAFSIYNQLGASIEHDSLRENRKRLMQVKSTKYATHFLDDSLRLQLLKKLEGCVLFAKKQQYISEFSDSEILHGLIDCYLQKSEKIMLKADLIEEYEDSGFLIFKNWQNHDVYYLGQMQDSMAHGDGFGLFSNESYYRGEWMNNKRHGEGRFETRKGELYIGSYAYDKRNGFGTYWFRNGDYYEGYWKDSKRDGIGTVYSAKGDTIVHGTWSADRLDRKRGGRSNGDNEE